MRVLIAEDQVLLREGMARLFQDRGHEIVAAAPDLVPAGTRLTYTVTVDNPASTASIDTCQTGTSRTRTATNGNAPAPTAQPSSLTEYAATTGEGRPATPLHQPQAPRRDGPRTVGRNGRCAHW